MTGLWAKLAWGGGRVKTLLRSMQKHCHWPLPPRHPPLPFATSNSSSPTCQVAAKPRKPAAPHAPRAPAAPKAPVLPKPAPAAPANRPAYAVPSAAPPKAGSKGSKAAAAAAPAPAPAAGSNEEDQEISEAPAESLSLAGEWWVGDWGLWMVRVVRLGGQWMWPGSKGLGLCCGGTVECCLLESWGSQALQ